MILTISDDRKINASTIEAGYREENKAFKLEFEIPEYLSEYGKKACFRAKDGTKFAKIFDNTIDNTLTFTSDMTKYKCLDCTIEFFKTENEEQIIAKTSMLHININNAIITDDIQEDDPQAILLNGLIENVTSATKDVNNLKNIMQQAEDERNKAEASRNTAENSRIKAEKDREEKQKEFLENLKAGKYNGSSGIAVQPNEPEKEDIIMWFDTDDEEDNYLDLEDVVEITNNLKEVAPLTNLEIEEIVNKIL